MWHKNSTFRYKPNFFPRVQILIFLLFFECFGSCFWYGPPSFKSNLPLNKEWNITTHHCWSLKPKQYVTKMWGHGYQCISPLMNSVSVNSRKEKKFSTNSKESHFFSWVRINYYSWKLLRSPQNRQALGKHWVNIGQTLGRHL